MTPERWQQVKDIFNSAIAYAPEERSSFISRACSGDEELRSEVESLIASHEQSGNFIGSACVRGRRIVTRRRASGTDSGLHHRSVRSDLVYQSRRNGRGLPRRRQTTRPQSRFETSAIDVHHERRSPATF